MRAAHHSDGEEGVNAKPPSTPRRPHANVPPMPLLEIRDLKKVYRTPEGESLTVLDVPEFALEAEQQLALRGASGSGKTTFLNCIAGILRPTSGSVLLNGINLSVASEGQRDRVRAENIGYIFQTFNLLQGYTCLENVLLGMSFSGKRADSNRAKELLQRVGLENRLGHRPAQLSVGEQQRVAVARALANRPSLLLADEPTANVDIANQETIIELIRDACTEHNVSLLMVTHSQEIAGQFDRVEKLGDFNNPGAAA